MAFIKPKTFQLVCTLSAIAAAAYLTTAQAFLADDAVVEGVVDGTDMRGNPRLRTRDGLQIIPKAMIPKGTEIKDGAWLSLELSEKEIARLPAAEKPRPFRDR